MRLIYLDPGLLHNLGHHATTCRFFVREVRALNIESTVIAGIAIQEQLRAELGAARLFRAYAAYPRDPDPISGWLSTFEAAAQMTYEDLQRLSGLGAGDLVYVNSLYPDILMAVVRWASGLDPTTLPTIVAEFATDPGLDIDVGDRSRYILRDPRADPRAVLYRYASRRIPSSWATRFHLATFDASASAAYAALLERPIVTLPVPIEATTSRRQRAGARPITLSVLGHQRQDKGYALVPEIVTALLDRRSDIRVLVHNGAPDSMPKPQQEMRELARRDNRITLDEQVAGSEHWARLLEQSDLILCPYDARRFATSYSAVACEAVANAIPLVVPVHTSLAQLLVEFGSPGTMFEAFAVPSIVEATNRALDDFDRYAAAARTASGQWIQTRGPQNFVRALLKFAPPQ